MEVRRSTRVAAARSRSILQPVAEENLVTPVLSQVRESLSSMGNTVGLRDTVNPQLRSSVGGTSLAGRKRSASGDAPGSPRRGYNPNKLASANDFPPGHFDEPNSDDHIPSLQCTPIQLSPMRIDSVIPANISNPDASPFSSTISQNPLLKPVRSHDRTPSPRRHPTASIHTRDSNRARTAMEGMFPIGQGFQAPGYAPVGGATYKIHSPQLGGSKSGKLDNNLSARGRKLFAEYTSTVEAGQHDPPLNASLQDVRIHPYTSF
jgi:hypothetical protein